MSDRHASLYLVSRIGAAVLNLVSVAVFTRLASPVVYGGYLVGFATSFIVFGAGFQWLMNAHFGIYTPERAARLAGALAACLGTIGLGVGLVLLALVALGWMSSADGIGMAALVAGFVIHVGAIEIGRARLLVKEVTAAGLLRGVLMLAFGSLALLVAQSAVMLLVAIGIAQVIAALPVLLTLMRGGVARPQRSDIEALLAYGWPLILALGAAALAINIDRIVLERVAGVAAVGPYGAIADVIRQGFVVLGEAIAAAYVSQAKATSDTLRRRTSLDRAFVTLWTVVAFGVLSWLVLGEGLLGFLLAPGYAQRVHAVLPLLAVGTACLVLRAYYFGQVIYFAGSVRREVIASGVLVALAVPAALLLIPAFGATGAAASFALAQLGGLMAFVIADRRDRVMPIDLVRAGIVLALCVATGLVATVALWLLGWWLATALILGAAFWLALRWNLFDSRTLAGQAAIRLRPSIRRQ